MFVKSLGESASGLEEASEDVVRRYSVAAHLSASDAASPDPRIALRVEDGTTAMLRSASTRKTAQG